MKPLTPATPHLIIMVGIPGSGKTTFAEHFAKTFGAPIVQQKQLQLQGSIDSDQALAVSELFLDELLKTGRTLIYDGATYQKKQRQALVKKATTAGYTPLLVWVQTESVEAKQRATRRIRDGLSLSEDEFDAAIRSFSPPTVQEKCTVISGKHTYTSQLKVVLKQLAGTRPEPTEPAAPRIRPRNIILR